MLYRLADSYTGQWCSRGKILLSAIRGTPAKYSSVGVNIKVVELKYETQVGGRVKRDVSVADESGMA